MEIFCEHCHTWRSYRVETMHRTKQIHHRLVTWVEEVPRCTTCGGAVFVHDLRDRNLARMEQAFTKGLEYEQMFVYPQEREQERKR